MSTIEKPLGGFINVASVERHSIETHAVLAFNDLSQCGTCHRVWCHRCEPTPAARCPFEYEHKDPEEQAMEDGDRTFGVQVTLDANGWLELDLGDLTTEMQDKGVHPDVIRQWEAILDNVTVTPRILMVDKVIAARRPCNQCGAFGYCHHR